MQQSGGLLLESGWTDSTPYVLPKAERHQIWPVLAKKELKYRKEVEYGTDQRLYECLIEKNV